MQKPIYFLIIPFLVLLFSVGCQSLGGGHYVGRGEFDHLNRRVDRIEEKMGLDSVKKTTALSAPPMPQEAVPATTVVKSTKETTITPPKAATCTASSPCDPPKAASVSNESLSEKASYERGQSLLKQKNYKQAADTFRTMLKQYPNGSLAPNARYWLGECHYVSREYVEAAREFQRCASDFPSSDKAPDALLKLSYSYDRLGNGPQAMGALDTLLKRYPNSSAAKMIISGKASFNE